MGRVKFNGTVNQIAKRSTTLSGYGIQDAYTKDETDEKVTEINATIDNKSDKPTISNQPGTSTNIMLPNNTDMRFGTMTALEITLPNTIEDDYIASVTFTSGVNPTNFRYPENIKFIGDDVTNGIFTAAKNKRYEVNIAYDGVNYIGVVGGYAI